MEKIWLKIRCNTQLCKNIELNTEHPLTFLWESKGIECKAVRNETLDRDFGVRHDKCENFEPSEILSLPSPTELAPASKEITRLLLKDFVNTCIFTCFFLQQDDFSQEQFTIHYCLLMHN